MMDLVAYMRTMATYNAWANRRLYAAATALPDVAYREAAGAYFGSLHGTLNHLLVVDRLWLWRLTGEGNASSSLDATLFDQLDDLQHAREAEDVRLEEYVAGLSPETLVASFDYATTGGTPQRQPRHEALAHLFNHQAHHRGQAHVILTRIGIAEPPSLDLLIMQREQRRRDRAEGAEYPPTTALHFLQG